MKYCRKAVTASIVVASSIYSLAAVGDDQTVASTVIMDKVDSDKAAAEFASAVQNARELCSDEYVIDLWTDNLGLQLVESFPRGFPVVTVKKISNPVLLQQHPELEVGAIVTAIGNREVDGELLSTIPTLVKDAPRPLRLKFRDPSRFFKLLDSTAGPPRRIITTSYLPANTRDAGAPEQLIRVERLELPPPERRTRAAQLLDVMEIQYLAQVQSDPDGRVVDSSAERAAPGTSSRSIYYVLGQRNGPPGKFPPGWDLTLRGMVAGERRRVTLPSSLAYDRKGDKLRGIPPFATMIYNVKLLSLT